MQPDLQPLLSAAGLKKADLARLMGVEKSTVTRWGQKGMAAETAMGIEAATKGAISKSDLRPDLWPIPASTEGRAA